MIYEIYNFVDNNHCSGNAFRSDNPDNAQWNYIISGDKFIILPNIPIGQQWRDDDININMGTISKDGQTIIFKNQNPQIEYKKLSDNFIYNNNEFINNNDEFIYNNDEFINNNDEFIYNNDEFINNNDEFINNNDDSIYINEDDALTYNINLNFSFDL